MFAVQGILDSGIRERKPFANRLWEECASGSVFCPDWIRHGGRSDYYLCSGKPRLCMQLIISGVDDRRLSGKA